MKRKTSRPSGVVLADREALYSKDDLVVLFRLEARPSREARLHALEAMWQEAQRRREDRRQEALTRIRAGR